MFSLKSLCKYIVSDLFKCVGITEHDIKIIDNSFYYDILLKKSLGVGEGYMNQKFTTNNLDVLLEKLTRLNHLKITDIPFRFSYIIVFGYFWIIKLYEKIAGFLFNFQSIEKSLEVAEIHYNLPNILYDNMLGETKLYSCAYFKDCESLDEAQIKKANLIMTKLKLQDSLKVLEVGCGWGFIASEIAKKYPHSRVVGVTNSREQFLYCIEKYANILNLNFINCDYRDFYLSRRSETYDRIYNVGFLEHVGDKNYKDFFEITQYLLKDEGISLVHSITNPTASGGNGDPWIRKYIFPGGYLPSDSRIISVIEQTKKLKLVHLQEFGFYYAKTLDCWNSNFEKNWSIISEKHPEIFNDKFYRLWEFYLRSCKVQFQMEKIHLTQFIITKNAKKVYHLD